MGSWGYPPPPPPTDPPLVQEVLAPLALVPAQPDPKEPKGREDPKGRPWLCTKIIEHPKPNKNPVQNGRSNQPIGVFDFLLLLGVFFQGCLLSCGVSEYFSHLDGWKHFGNQVQFHHVVRGSNFANFHDGHSFFWWQHHLQLMDLSTDTLNLLHCS